MKVHLQPSSGDAIPVNSFRESYFFFPLNKHLLKKKKSVFFFKMTTRVYDHLELVTSGGCPGWL